MQKGQRVHTTGGNFAGLKATVVAVGQPATGRYGQVLLNFGGTADFWLPTAMVQTQRDRDIAEAATGVPVFRPFYKSARAAWLCAYTQIRFFRTEYEGEHESRHKRETTRNYVGHDHV